MQIDTSSHTDKQDYSLSLVQLLEPEVLANPYPLYHRLRSDCLLYTSPSPRDS